MKLKICSCFSESIRALLVLILKVKTAANLSIALSLSNVALVVLVVLENYKCSFTAVFFFLVRRGEGGTFILSSSSSTLLYAIAMNFYISHCHKRSHSVSVRRSVSNCFFIYKFYSNLIFVLVLRLSASFFLIVRSSLMSLN